MFITYEKCTRRLFAVVKRVLSPPGVEGVSFFSPDNRQIPSSPQVKRALPYSSAEHVQDRGKKPLHDEGNFDDQDKYFLLAEEDDIDLGSQDSKLKDVIIKEKEAEIQALSL